MVYVNDKKFACETCIKGHRSSSCNHTDRPLYEIKKKGRPISQCERCRQLRQVKKKHTKCTCAVDNNADTEASGSGSRAKSRRFIPIAPALPNGLKDTLTTGPSLPSDPRQKVDSLLNPCPCDSARNCRCMTSGENAHETDGAHSAGFPTPTEMNTGLAALAQAAALCCREGSTLFPVPAVPFEQMNTNTKNGGGSSSGKHARDSPPGSSHGTSSTHKRTRSIPVSIPMQVPTHSQRGPDLPPIQLPNSFPTDYTLPATPFTIPPLSTFTSLAGSGCCCGLKCACPGCVEHRGVEHAAEDRDDCPGCGSCIDYDGGVELPAQSFVTRMTTALSVPAASGERSTAQSQGTAPVTPKGKSRA